MRSHEVKYVGGTRGTVAFVYVPGETTPGDLVRAVERVNPAYHVSVGEPGSVKPPSDDVDFRTVSARDGYEVAPLLAKGRVTVVQFSREGDWASSAFAMRLNLLAQRHGCALRKVGLDGAGAEAQFAREFGRALPYARVYGRDGTFAGEGTTGEEIESLVRGR